MAIPSEKLAQSLDVLRQLQESKNSPVIRSSEISRTHYERLAQNGFLMKVVGGWYIQSDPAAVSGDTTAWYISYWRFISEYVREKLVDSNVDFPQIVIEKGATKRGTQR